jgi:GT2 family glycosyltransferase
MIGRDFIVCTVAHMTYGWIQQCLTSFFRLFPDLPMLVIDNNPSVEDDKRRTDSYNTIWYPRTKAWKRHFCEAERYWLNQQNNVIMLKTPKYYQHGVAIDMANQWAKDNGINYIVLIDPDSICVTGEWLETLISTIKKGYWLVAGGIHPSKVMHLLPSAWKVKEALKYSFIHRSHGEETEEVEFSQIVDVSKLQLQNWGQTKWDVGQYFWYQCAKQNKAHYVPCRGWKHFGMGSRSKNPFCWLYL